MISFFYNLNSYTLALIFSFLTFILTMAGSSLVFIMPKNTKKYTNILISISAGIMLSSTIFSLINPAIDEAIKINTSPIIVASLGLILGALTLFICNKFSNNNGMIGYTIHNFPEGAAIGAAFAICALDKSNMISAISLAIGIGIQNFPEGTAVSFPLYLSGAKKTKAFLLGTLSAASEPIGALVGVSLAITYPILLPFLLSYAAGAMLFEIAIELIPDAMNNEKKDISALFFITGFILMMILDIYFS